MVLVKKSEPVYNPSPQPVIVPKSMPASSVVANGDRPVDDAVKKPVPMEITTENMSNNINLQPGKVPSISFNPSRLFFTKLQWKFGSVQNWVTGSFLEAKLYCFQTFQSKRNQDFHVRQVEVNHALQVQLTTT